MPLKRKIQMGIDFVMVALLPVLMAYSLVGEEVHEWAGMTIFLFFIIHHILNWRWYKNLNQGRYSAIRIFSTVLNLLLGIIMFALPLSGIMMSRHTFLTRQFNSGTDMARTIHLITSYWGFVLMSLHLGLHWNMIIHLFSKVLRIESPNIWRTTLLRIITGAISIYGIYAFIIRQFGEYIILKTQFVFFDHSEPIYFFFIDYLAVMGLFVCVGHYIAGFLRRSKKAGIVS